MPRQKGKELIGTLNPEYPAAAIHFRFEKPDIPHYEGPQLAFCQYLKYTQDTGKHFCIDVNDDACYCKLVMGMIDMPPVTASGQAGYDFGCCKAPIANQRLYQRLPILLPDTIHDRDDPNLQKQHPMRTRVLFLLLCSD